LGTVDDPAWWRRQVDQLPMDFLLADSTDEVIHRLRQLQLVPEQKVVAWGKYLEDRNAVAYTVGTFEEITPGIFHKLTGALSSQGMQILSAEIHTLSDNLVLDRFHVEDMDFSGPPPQERIDQVSESLVKALTTSDAYKPVFRRTWGADRNKRRPGDMPTQVRFDNHTSEQFTIVNVFAYDRRGLLYDVTRALFELGLSVYVAKIGTYLDQVVDVFYVNDRQGAKVEDDERLAEIRERLLTAIGG
jgi:[protein-PII] uridylyltransferase